MLDRLRAARPFDADEGLGSFIRARERFFERHGPRWPGALADPFDLLEVHPLDPAEIRAIEAATACVGAIYERIRPILHSLEDEALLAMGVRREALHLARTTIPGLELPVLARVDLAHTPEGFKLLEYNGEAPGLLVETFGLNALACAAARQRDANRSGRALLATAVCDAVRLGVEYIGGDAEQAVVAFSYHLGSDRDRAAARFLAELVEDASGMRPVAMPIESLRATGEGLSLPDGRRLHVLWRSGPIHYLGAALSTPLSTPEECTALVASLVRQRKLALVNAPDASLLSSKAAQAVIFGLAEEGLYFTDEEAAMVRTYFLPTFLDPPGDDNSYVIKPAFGCEGDSITIVDRARREVRQSACTSYRGDTQVYQKYVAVPTARLMTEYGPRDLRVVTSCFLVCGRPAGLILRAGEEITDDEAWVVPVGAGETEGE